MRIALCSCLALILAAPVAVAADPKPLRTQISEVTVYADRAQVTRTAVIDLVPGGVRFAIEKLPGWIDQESLRATLSPTTRGRIVDVTVEKSFLVQASEEAVRKAERAVEEINDQLAVIADEERVLKAENAQLEAIRAFSLEKVPRDMATRDVKVKTIAETIDFITGSLRDNHSQLREANKRRRALAPELAARQRALNELRARAQLEQSTAFVEVAGSGRATLSLSYLTPGATWEPVGEMRVSGGGRSVELTQFASVVQTTGEDWTGAKLTFATQRPDETLGVPEVQALLLGDGGTGLGEVMQRMGESFTKAQSSYWSRNTILGKGSTEWQLSIDNQRLVQERAQTIFQQLARRGTTTHFAAQGSRAVRADGKAVRVPITSAAFAASLQVVAVPEVSLNAVRSAKIRNGDDLPILPGSVALFVDGAFIGTTDFQFVAPGEQFSTFLGVHDRIKLERVIDRKRSKIERGKKTTEVRVSYNITAENLSDVPVEVDLGDRVPVSQIEDIEVDDIKTPKQSKRARDGIVRWTATLKPKTKESWRIEYSLEYPTDLLQRVKSRRAPSPAPDQMLFEDIEQLENTLQ